MLSYTVPVQLPPCVDGLARIAVSRTRPPAFVAHFAEAWDAQTIPMGSAGVKIAAALLVL